jgi:hypothetical protein
VVVSGVFVAVTAVGFDWSAGKESLKISGKIKLKKILLKKAT